MTTNDLANAIAELRQRFTAPTIPPCWICGGPLSLGACEAGRNEWYCESQAAKDDIRHWQSSRHIQTQFRDDAVLAVCDEVERLIPIVNSLESHLTKTRKAADERIKRHGQDGLTIQLQSEATLLDMILHTEANP